MRKSKNFGQLYKLTTSTLQYLSSANKEEYLIFSRQAERRRDLLNYVLVLGIHFIYKTNFLRILLV